MMIKYIFKDIYRYIFRYIPWVIIGFLISLLFSSFNVKAETMYSNFAMNPNNGTTLYYQDNTNTSLIWTGVGGVGLGNMWKSNVLPYSTGSTKSFLYSFGTNFNDSMLDYSHFNFMIYTTTHMELSGAMNTSSMNGVCKIETVGHGIDINFQEPSSISTIVFGLNAYSVTCDYSNISSSTSFTIPLKWTYSDDDYIIISNWWTFYTDDNLTQELITQQKEQINQQKETNNQLQDMNDNITSSDTDNDNVSNTLNNVSLGDEGVITQLITLPINLFTNILNSINGQCNSFNLGNLFGTNLTLPCINIENIVGSNLWSIIDILFSGFSIYYISNKIKRIFEHITNLREGDILND